jgi:hypothetical protein
MDINSYQTLEAVVMTNKLCLRGHNDQQTLLVSLGNGREHLPPSLSKDKHKYYKSFEKENNKRFDDVETIMSSTLWMPLA